MRKQITIILPLVLLTMMLAGQQSSRPGILRQVMYDTMPNICSYLPATDIAALHPFTTPLSSSFPDPNNFEIYNGCQYQFFTNNDKPQLAIRLLKKDSKQDALDEYNMNVQRHHESWGVTPERIAGIGDSAYFSIETMDSSKCDECHLLVIQGLYSVYISFKGQYDGPTRSGKKSTALKILQMMYDRIPGLAPSRIRNKQ